MTRHTIALPAVAFAATIAAVAPAQVTLTTDPVAFDLQVQAAGKVSKFAWNLEPNDMPINASVTLNPLLDINTHASNPNDPWFTPPNVNLWPPAVDNVRFTSNQNPGTGILVNGPAGSLGFATPFALPQINHDFLGENTFSGNGSFDVILGAPVNDEHTAVGLSIQGVAGLASQSYVISVFDPGGVLRGQFQVAGIAGQQTFVGILRQDGPIGRVDVWDINGSFEGITSIETFEVPPPPCEVFDDLVEFSEYNQNNGQQVEGFENFEAPVTNVPDGAIAAINDPLWFGRQNVDGGGLGFPNGVATVILIMQSNELGADAPQTNFGAGLAVFGAGSVVSPCPADCDPDGVVGINDLLDLLAAWGPCPGCCIDLDGDGAVGINDLLDLLAAWGPCPEKGPGSPETVAVGAEILADSTDLLFSSGLDNHTGIGMLVFDPLAEPGGTIHIAVFDDEGPVTSAILEATTTPQFWGISSLPCGATIRRINVAALTGGGAPSHELVDDIRTWEDP